MHDSETVRFVGLNLGIKEFGPIGFLQFSVGKETIAKTIVWIWSESSPKPNQKGGNQENSHAAFALTFRISCSLDKIKIKKSQSEIHF